jgi:hypothetical protein
MVTPAAGVIVSRLSGSSFAETDPVDSGAFAVTGRGSTQTFVSPYVTVGVSQDFVTASGHLDPRRPGRLAQRSHRPGRRLHPHRGRRDQLRPQPALDRSSALLGASLTVHKAAWTVFFKYRADVAGDWTSQTLAIGARIAF